MKIVLLTNILSPYRKVFYDKLYSGFRDIGVEFSVLVMAESEPGRHWRYQEYKSVYCELLESRTFTISNICFHYNKDFKQKLFDFKPDILIVSGSYLSPSVLRAIQLKKKLKYKLIFWSESHLDESRSYNLFKLKVRDSMRRYTYKRFDGFWFAGEKSLKLINKYINKNNNYHEKKRINYYFVPNLVDNTYFKQAYDKKKADRNNIKEILKLPKDKFIFTLPARLIKEKGILPFLELLNQSQFKNLVSIVILGDGSLRSEIEAFAYQNQIDVKLTGYLEHQEILNYYAGADCFLLPSISDANPLSSIEALWAGLPLLVSDHVGNYPETVRNELNGYVFSYESPQAAIEIINKIIHSEEDWRNEAEKISLQIAEEVFEPNRCVSNLIVDMMQDYYWE